MSVVLHLDHIHRNQLVLPDIAVALTVLLGSQMHLYPLASHSQLVCTRSRFIHSWFWYRGAGTWNFNFNFVHESLFVIVKLQYIRTAPVECNFSIHYSVL